MGRSPTEDYVIVYDVTLALCALSLSLNLCCLLVCAIQFLFAVKLVRSPMFDGRDNKYLEKSSVSRTCAVGGFFISIPIFLTGEFVVNYSHRKIIKQFPSLLHRHNSLHLQSLSLHARYYYKRFDWHWHCFLRRRHGAQCLHLAKGENHKLS